MDYYSRGSLADIMAR